jgi:hypothetical protein
MDITAVSGAFANALHGRAPLGSTTCILLTRPGAGPLQPNEAVAICQAFGEKGLRRGYIVPLPDCLAVVLYFPSRVTAFVPCGLQGFSAKNCHAVTHEGVDGAALAALVHRTCTPVEAVGARDTRVASNLSPFKDTALHSAPVESLLARVHAAEAQVEALRARCALADAALEALQARCSATEQEHGRLRADLQLLRNTCAAFGPRWSAKEVYLPPQKW